MLSIAYRLCFMISIVIKGLHVFNTEASTSSFKFTPYNNTNFLFIILRNKVLRPVNYSFSVISVVFCKMLRIANHQFKVFNSIVCFVSVYVMNVFCFCKGSSKVLFHQISMLLNSVSINIDPKVSVFGEARFTFFVHSPVRRNIIIPMSRKTTSMFSTNLTLNRVKNFVTTIYSTYISFSHINIVTQGGQNVNP